LRREGKKMSFVWREKKKHGNMCRRGIGIGGKKGKTDKRR